MFWNSSTIQSPKPEYNLATVQSPKPEYNLATVQIPKPEYNLATIQSPKPEYNWPSFQWYISFVPFQISKPVISDMWKKTWWLEQAKIYIYWNLIIKIQMRVSCVEKEMFTGVLMWSVLVIFSGLCVLALLIDCLFVIIIYSVTVWHENININMIQNIHPRFLVGFELFNGSFSMWWYVYNCHFVWLSLLVFNHY